MSPSELTISDKPLPPPSRDAPRAELLLPGHLVEQRNELRSYLLLLRRQLWLIAAVAVATTAAAAYLVHRQAPVYKATAVIRLVDARGVLTSGINDPTGRLMASGSDFMLSQIQILQSRSLLERVVDQEGLRLYSRDPKVPVSSVAEVRIPSAPKVDSLIVEYGQNQVTVRAGGETARAAYGQPLELQGIHLTVSFAPPVRRAVLHVRPTEAAVSFLSGRFVARQRPRTDVIDLEFSAADPLLAQRVVNAIAEVYQAVSAETAQQVSRRRRIFIESRLRQTDSVLATAQAALSDFRSREQVYSSKDKFVANQGNLFNLDLRREELLADKRTFETMLAKIQDRPGTWNDANLRTLVSSPAMSGSPIIPQLYSQLMQHQYERDTLTTGAWARAATNPDVVRLDTLIARARSGLVGAMRSQLASVQVRIAALDALRASGTAALRRAPGTEAEEEHLVREMETTRRLADQLREGHQEARIAEAVEAGQVEVVDLAGLPTVPIGTSPQRKIALAALIGLLLGVVLAFGMENLNTTIREREEMDTVLQIPALGVVPKMTVARSPRDVLERMPFGLSKLARQETEAMSTLFAGPLRPGAAEAYRMLRTSLVYSQWTQKIKTLGVTSAAPGDGKTTTAINLAVTYAEHGVRVLLIDCDLRRPRIHKVFGVPRDPGLSELLLEPGEWEERIRPTGVERLDILPSGTGPPNAAELLSSDRMKLLLARLAARYELIVIDTPPVLAASDASILGSVVDGVLFVVRAGRTDRAAAQQAVRHLGTVGSRVVGGVLNDPDSILPKRESYYYYQEYAGKNA